MNVRKLQTHPPVFDDEKSLCEFRFSCLPRCFSAGCRHGWVPYSCGTGASFLIRLPFIGTRVTLERKADMMTDIEIARQCRMKRIADVAAEIGIAETGLELYGPYKAKVTFDELRRLNAKSDDLVSRGKLILVTAMTPTPAGEGKSTVSIGLGDALRHIGKKSVIALREPSLGPCFGVKGGAAGGGYSQIVPMEDINLHFTGDIHAVTAANNLLASVIDNHIQQGNALGIDPRAVSWKRCIDLNDRFLRHTVIGLGGTSDGVPREEQFTITAASEIMAILCLSRSIADLKKRLSDIVVGRSYGGNFVRAERLNVTGALAAVLRDALRPNLVQTLEHTPVFVHGGPFANIAHGCNSLNATRCALASGDYVVTEAGFGADLGAEKFMDIKCRAGSIRPDAAVIVITVRALKMHGGVPKTELGRPDSAAAARGFENVRVHIENVRSFGVPVVAAINRFSGDTEEELRVVRDLAAQTGIRAVEACGWEKGGAGAADLAREVVSLCGQPGCFEPLYADSLPLDEKIVRVASRIYRASGVDFSPAALRKLRLYTDEGYGTVPVCIAKTQNSISHDKNLVGAPSGYRFPVRDVQLFAGAGFVTAFAENILTMPGLPRVPAAEAIDIDDSGVISGLF